MIQLFAAFFLSVGMQLSGLGQSGAPEALLINPGTPLHDVAWNISTPDVSEAPEPAPVYKEFYPPGGTVPSVIRQPTRLRHGPFSPRSVFGLPFCGHPLPLRL